MIVTVTPNPSIDRTLRLPVLRRGEVVRASASTSEAGGKGLETVNRPVRVSSDGDVLVVGALAQVSSVKISPIRVLMRMTE